MYNKINRRNAESEEVNRRTREQTEAQYARVRTLLAQRTPNPSVGLSSLSNMGGQNGRIANLYARATRGYTNRIMASRAQGLSNG